MHTNSKLYIELLKDVANIKSFAAETTQYQSFLTFSEFNEKCAISMLSNNIVPRHNFFQKIPLLEAECKRCWKFYLNPRNKSIKQYDVIYGQKFENAFIRFLNRISIKSNKADIKDKVLPDNQILNKKGEIVVFYELKYHNAPFVLRYQTSDGRECYEGSITLDYIKVQNQIKAIKRKTDKPVLYVHWVDFPCIKGVFFMSLSDTERELVRGIEFVRQERQGDYVVRGSNTKKVGYTQKFYPSLLKMCDFETLVSYLREVILV